MRRSNATACMVMELWSSFDLIAEFYLVDRGLRHRLPGFSSLNRRLSLRRVSAGSGTNGHTAVVALRGRTPGERGWFDRN